MSTEISFKELSNCNVAFVYWKSLLLNYETEQFKAPKEDKFERFRKLMLSKSPQFPHSSVNIN